MRFFLDACVPRPLRRAFPDLDVTHAHDRGWGDLDDGPLLDRVAGQYDVFLTTERNLPYQQDLTRRPFAILVLGARANRVPELLPLVPLVREALPTLERGQVRVLGA